jgi:gluconate 2-dehydrogenase gamma chain
MDSSGRRRFLKSAAAMGAVLPAGVAAQTPKHDEHHDKHHAEHHRAQAPAYMFFTEPEVAFVDAAVARLIPADELGPGAKEAGVALFIDRQLFGGWGTMAKMYRQGPHPEGTPQQGYQSPLTPQEVYRAAIRDVNAHCAKQCGKGFDRLASGQQDEVLRGLDTGKIELDTVRSQFFFNMLLANTIEGFFSDPIYGGNRGKVGWKLVGFPGVAAVYTQHIGRTTPYEAQPVSIQDIVDNVAQVDEHGHAKHVRIFPSPSQGEGEGGG